MSTRRSHILAPLIQTDSGTKGRKILWVDALEDSFKELKCMFYTDTLLSYPDWNIAFMVHMDASDKQLVSVISHINKLISFFSIRLSQP